MDTNHVLISIFSVSAGHGAPGETRTHTGRVLNPLPLPIGLLGRALNSL